MYRGGANMSKAMFSAAVAILICVEGPSSLAAEADDRIRPRFSLDLALLAGVEPVHGNLPDEDAVFYGGDLRVRLAVVSLGMRVERTAGFSPAGVDGFTRVLGTLGFNIGLGSRTALSPYLGVGSMHTAGSSHSSHPDEGDARVGLEVEHFLTRNLSIGGGIAFDVRTYGGGDGITASAALSGVCRLGFHLPLG
jgi:hypothetical protein